MACEIVVSGVPNSSVRRVFAWAIAFVLLLGGCSASGPSVLCVGGGLSPMTLRGDPAATDPVWVVGPSGETHHVIWPAGITATFDPELELRASDGQVIARGGETLENWGGTAFANGDIGVCQVNGRS
jgi:hypothetical protein